MNEQKLSELRGHVDAVAGAQVAMMAVISLLLEPHRGNQHVTEAVRHLGEQAKAGMLASSASDYKIEAFDATMQAILEKLGG